VPYQAEISRRNPSCFLFLIDQSGSMGDRWGQDSSKSKAETLADVINRLLMNLVLKCAKDDGVRDYFEVGVIGYSTGVSNGLGAVASGQWLVPISRLADHPLRVEQRMRREPDGAGGIVEVPARFPIWFEPRAEGATAMCAALRQAEEILGTWTRSHPDSFPPVVFHITDGEATDGSPLGPAAAVRATGTSDGKTLLYNVHISDRQGAEVAFPANAEAVADPYGRILFEMSSELPDSLRTRLGEEGERVPRGARGFLFNADPVAVIHFLDIGTRPANLR
jgi:hypothetical protein